MRAGDQYMNVEMSADQRGWAMAARPCGLLWVLGTGRTAYRRVFCLRLVK